MAFRTNLKSKSPDWTDPSDSIEFEFLTTKGTMSTKGSKTEARDRGYSKASTDFEGATNRSIGKLVELNLRALRALRGESFQGNGRFDSGYRNPFHTTRSQQPNWLAHLLCRWLVLQLVTHVHQNPAQHVFSSAIATVTPVVVVLGMFNDLCVTRRQK